MGNFFGKTPVQSMANEQNEQLPLEELEELKIKTNFTEKEIKILWQRFILMRGPNRTKQVTLEEVKQMKEFANNPLVDRIFVTLKTPTDLSFREFVLCLSIFAIGTPKEAKIKFAFKLYDFDGDGKLSRDDLEKMFSVVTGARLTETELKETLDNVMMEMCKSTAPTSKITFDDFAKTVQFEGVESRYTIEFL